MNDREQKKTIGVFDSGLGGLTILHELLRALPEYNFDYLGDTARAPYGPRDHGEITQFTEQAVNFLFDQGATLVIIACSTASAVSLRHLQIKYLREPGVTDKKILGIIFPTVEETMEQTDHERIAVLATEATVSTNAFAAEIHKADPKCEVKQIPCPGLAAIVEKGLEDSPEADQLCKTYLKDLALWKPDAVILGCTHYPFLRRAIDRAIPPGTQIIEQGPAVARRTTDYLKRHPEIENQLAKSGRLRFFATGSAEHMQQHGSKYLGRPIDAVTHVKNL